MLEDSAQLIASRRGAVCRGLEKPLHRLYQVLVDSSSVEEGEAQIEFARSGPRLRCLAIPPDRLICLARIGTVPSSAAQLVHVSKVILCRGMTLYRSTQIPLHRFRITLFQPHALQVQSAQTVLRPGVPGVGCLPVPASSLGVILRDPATSLVLQASLELGVTIAIGGIAQQSREIVAGLDGWTGGFTPNAGRAGRA